jgi:hypothetical protein
LSKANAPDTPAPKNAPALRKPVCGGYAQTMPDLDHEETTYPLVADARNFYKVEKWTATERRLIASFMLATVLAGPVQSSVRSSTGRGST